MSALEFCRLISFFCISPFFLGGGGDSFFLFLTLLLKLGLTNIAKALQVTDNQTISSIEQQFLKLITKGLSDEKCRDLEFELEGYIFVQRNSDGKTTRKYTSTEILGVLIFFFFSFSFLFFFLFFFFFFFYFSSFFPFLSSFSRVTPLERCTMSPPLRERRKEI